MPLFWSSGEICPGFQSQGGSPHLHALSLVYNGILRFTSGVTPTDLLVANMAVKPFWSTYLQTSIGGAQVSDLCAPASHRETGQTLHCLIASIWQRKHFHWSNVSFLICKRSHFLSSRPSFPFALTVVKMTETYFLKKKIWKIVFLHI